MYLHDAGSLIEKPFAFWAEAAGKHKLTVYEMVEGARFRVCESHELGKIIAEIAAHRLSHLKGKVMIMNGVIGNPLRSPRPRLCACGCGRIVQPDPQAPTLK
jgi:hypothetical protein